MAFSKKFLLVGLAFAFLLISSEVVSALRDLAETTANTQNSNTDHYHVDDATLGHGGYHHWPPHHGGHGPGETTTTTENSNTDGYHGGHGGHYGGGGGGHYGGGGGGHYGGGGGHYGGGGHHGGGAHETETKN